MQQQTVNFQKKTEASIKEFTTLIEKINSQGKLLSQTEPNPRQNANAVTLRSGKELEPNLGKNFNQDSTQKKQQNDH
ncbi:hypothetical protein EPI10_021533 [Gossypium australe]|uniref:Uncharacterized protein n=1 Tax=Gossypium australe TaxID=47621 RepID=A0A5B6WGX5_9ROSI|nr:hypothetical protein EPI10_021533 [Gossypium australe]